jgi:hypothetical protein
MTGAGQVTRMHAQYIPPERMTGTVQTTVHNMYVYEVKITLFTLYFPHAYLRTSKAYKKLYYEFTKSRI